jgi:hypothetical protein
MRTCGGGAVCPVYFPLLLQRNKIHVKIINVDEIFNPLLSGRKFTCTFNLFYLFLHNLFLMCGLCEKKREVLSVNVRKKTLLSYFGKYFFKRRKKYFPILEEIFSILGEKSLFSFL